LARRIAALCPEEMLSVEGTLRVDMSDQSTPPTTQTTSDGHDSRTTLEGGDVKRWSIFAYSLPSIPIAALGLPLVVALPPYYAAEAGLSAATVGIVLMLCRFWDMFTDPVLGVISDRTRTRWGRRRPWMVVAVPILMLAVYMVFFPMDGANALYLGFWMFALYVGWTLLTISHMSWGSELSTIYHQRSRVHGWREFGNILGMVLVLALPFLLTKAFNQPESVGFQAMGLFVIVLLPILVVIAVATVPERHAVEVHGINWKQGLKLIGRNKPLRYVLAVDLLGGLATGVTGTLFFWFIGIVMDLPGQGFFLLFFYFISGLIAVPFWIAIATKFSKHRTYAAAMAFGAVTLPLIFFFPPGAFLLVLAGHVLYGIAYGAQHFLVRSMMADVCDHDAMETGQERTGIYMALLAMTAKAGLALAVGFTTVVLDAVGFDLQATRAENTDLALNTFYFLYLAVPALFMGANALIIWNFPLTEDVQAETRKRFEEMKAEHAYVAMASGFGEATGAVIDPLQEGEDGKKPKPAE